MIVINEISTLYLCVIIVVSGITYFCVGQALGRKVQGKWNGQIAVHFQNESENVYHFYCEQFNRREKIPNDAVIDRIILCGANAGSMPRIQQLFTFYQGGPKKNIAYGVYGSQIGACVQLFPPTGRPCAKQDEDYCELQLLIVSEEVGSNYTSFELFWETIPEPVLA